MRGLYEEWSASSRAAIESRGLLRPLGFLETPADKAHGGPAEEKPFMGV